MRIVDYDNIKTFRDTVMPLLARDECLNCVMIGIIERLAEGKAATRSGEPSIPLLLAIQKDDQLVGAAVQTPPHALLFTAMDAASCTALAEHLHYRKWNGSEFSGIADTARNVATSWGQLKGTTPRKHLGLRLFRTSLVIDPPPATGVLRPATMDDLPLTSRWAGEFGEEIREPNLNPARSAQIATEEGRLHLWVDGEPRAICAWQGPTAASVRIGLVYTPSPFRGRGYASNAVAQLTQKMLSAGRTFCTLFTDAANPTSNSIYQKIGYEYVADFEHLKFS